MMRRLANEDARLWRLAMRDVAPLPGRAPPRDPEPLRGDGHSAPIIRDAGETPAVREGAPQIRLPPLDAMAGLDRANAERLRRGRRAIEARLDLHGLTQAEAHRALSGFIAGSRAGGRRCVLVITGRGRAGGGVLKEAVPRWLAEPGLRRDILAIAMAQPRHGGAGALYLLLRKQVPQPG